MNIPGDSTKQTTPWGHQSRPVSWGVLSNVLRCAPGRVVGVVWACGEILTAVRVDVMNLARNQGIDPQCTKSADRSPLFFLASIRYLISTHTAARIITTGQAHTHHASCGRPQNSEEPALRFDRDWFPRGRGLVGAVASCEGLFLGLEDGRLSV